MNSRGRLSASILLGTLLLPNAANAAQEAITSEAALTLTKNPFARTTPQPVAAAKRAARLKVKAIVLAGEQSMAQINGRFVGLGDKMSGWEVVRIDARTVEMKRQENLRVITLDEGYQP